jgi:hypothetical protein
MSAFVVEDRTINRFITWLNRQSGNNSCYGCGVRAGVGPSRRPRPQFAHFVRGQTVQGP